MGDIVDSKKKFKKGWIGGLPETPCGHGSKLSTTVEQRKWIPQIVKQYKIKSIADIGAGDLNWISHINFPKSVKYTAYDLFPRAEEVIEFDLVTEKPPKVDLIMCLWVLNHFKYDDCEKALNNLLSSGASYLMMTDRPIWHKEQPPSIVMPYVEKLVLNDKQDSILLIDLKDI